MCSSDLFADDVKMYATLDVNDDCKGLFDKLKSVEKWCSEWQLSISVKKCAVMHIHSGNVRPVIGPSFTVYLLNYTILAVCLFLSLLFSVLIL